MVKNAVIVPVGSKGGFVVKRPPRGGGREALQAEGIACYRTFLRGLLDLTDNYVGGEVVRAAAWCATTRTIRIWWSPPTRAPRRSRTSPTRSRPTYGFWLGDAFASGGSDGYDHKAMGITARGAWESVKRHFRELGKDIQTSRLHRRRHRRHVRRRVRQRHAAVAAHRLLAAFDHLHVFLDPDPDPRASFAERQRLFDLPRSSWSDYDPALISPGGGVYLRSAKSIPITPEVREALGIDAEHLAPADLIRRLLCAPVDLLFNGGIGTYVKAAGETQANAGDQANDAVRVDGAAAALPGGGEGGNLGLTQRGRIEYALPAAGRAGGSTPTRSTTSAGVNCSDHEVNIKILLGDAVAAGELTFDQRNALLAEMTDAVGDQVLYSSYTQTQAMSLGEAQAVPMLEVHARVIRGWRRSPGWTGRSSSCPPRRRSPPGAASAAGWSGPSWRSSWPTARSTSTPSCSTPTCPTTPTSAQTSALLPRADDRALRRRRSASHRLRRELIATIVANELVDRAGMTFAFRLAEETGGRAPLLARAYAVARDVFEMREYWGAVEALDNQIEAGTQLAMLLEGRRLVERAARWVVGASNRGPIDVTAMTEHFAAGAQTLAAALPEVLRGQDRDKFSERRGELEAAGVPLELAHRVASMQSLLSVFDIVVDAGATGNDQAVVTETYFGVGARLGLDWLRDRVLELPRDDRWQALARAALRDDLYRLHRSLTREILLSAADYQDDGPPLEGWLERNGSEVERAQSVLADVGVAQVRHHDAAGRPARAARPRSPTPGS